jgi:diguanylate cyclase (GGDEF)-like protein
MVDQGKSSSLINVICTTFGLQEQAQEVVDWAGRTLDSKAACLFFISFDEINFGILASISDPSIDHHPSLNISRYDPVVNHLRREKKLISGNILSNLLEFKDFREKLGFINIELISPLISRQKLLGILVLGNKRTGNYSNEDYDLLNNIAGLVAPGLEKEYLREKLIRHQDQLSTLYADIIEKVRIDDLTGLFNRRSFDETIRSEVSRYSRYSGVFSLIVCDIDGMKTVNDRYGHLAGDEALREMGRVIRNSIRSSDQAFRYGGDEFAILLPNTPIGAATNVAERVRKQIDSIAAIGQERFTVSCGISTWPVNGKDVNDIIAAADAALYQSKRNGGNQCQVAQLQREFQG